MNFREKKALGRTGLSVSRLGLAGGYGIPAPAVEKAFHEYGVNYFYWSTPRRAGMGEGLRNLVKSRRESIIIVLQTYDHIGVTLKRSIRSGLKTLGIEYADVALLGFHYWYPSKRIINQALELKESGLVRFIAMSGHNRKLFGRIAQDGDSPIDIFMVRYNAVHRGAEQDIFPYLSLESPPGLTTYTATRWGHLLKPGKMPSGEKPLTASDCYRFALSHPSVDLCMMGPRNEREMLDGIAAMDQGPLSDEEMDRVKRIGDHIHG